MSRSGSNSKRRRKKTNGRQQVQVHALQQDTMDITKQGLDYYGSEAQQRERKYNKPLIQIHSVVSHTHNVKPQQQSQTQYQAQPQQQPHKDWKTVIQSYITRYNQAETEQHSDRLERFTTDPLHSERVGKRLARMRERDLYRGAIVTGSDTKAEIISVNETESEVIIFLKFHVKRKINQLQQQYVEERVDLERIWLSSEKNNWVISRVEPVTPERKPRYPITATDWSWSDFDEEEQPKSIVKPYLNPDLISSIRPVNQAKRYRREQAVAYADQWWNTANPSYEEFEANCTNYVSQCIFAGEAPMLYTNRRDSGWWYKGRGVKGKEWWSYSWAVSRSLTTFFSRARNSGLRAVEVQKADQLELGDIIVYDWNGNNTFQHSTIVTAFDSQGQPLVNANTTASKHRYWDYQDSYAWTPNTRYRFFHISDYL